MGYKRVSQIKRIKATSMEWAQRIKMRKRECKTKHHIVNQSDGGTQEEHNILTLYNDRHELWHILFKKRTIKEAIQLLKRVDRLKRKECDDVG